MILDLHAQGGLDGQLILLLMLFVMKNYLWELLMIRGGILEEKVSKS